MAFNESNTVEAYLFDLLAGPAKPVAVNVVQQPESHYGRAHKGLGWRLSPAPTFRDRHRKSWLRNGYARR